MSIDRSAEKVCIYPGCGRPAVPPHVLGGPQPSFCELEEHNALTAHQERRRLADRNAGASPQRLAGEGAGPDPISPPPHRSLSAQEVPHDGQ